MRDLKHYCYTAVYTGVISHCSTAAGTCKTPTCVAWGGDVDATAGDTQGLIYYLPKYRIKIGFNSPSLPPSVPFPFPLFLPISSSSQSSPLSRDIIISLSLHYLPQISLLHPFHFTPSHFPFYPPFSYPYPISLPGGHTPSVQLPGLGERCKLRQRVGTLGRTCI